MYAGDMHTIDPQVAFDHAIKVGAFGVTPDGGHEYVGDYMYMYSDRVPWPGNDYFKHIDSRQYVTVPHS
jgi:hypothetical protein